MTQDRTDQRVATCLGFVVVRLTRKFLLDRFLLNFQTFEASHANFLLIHVQPLQPVNDFGDAGEAFDQFVGWNPETPHAIRRRHSIGGNLHARGSERLRHPEEFVEESANASEVSFLQQPTVFVEQLAGTREVYIGKDHR